MTPTETSATTTPLTPGRDLDVAVARAMDLECRDDRSLPQVWVRPTDHWVPFDVSTDDATALRWGVPWLRVRGFTVRITIGPYGVWVCLFERFASGPVEGVQGKAETLAAALAQVIVAVSMVK